MNTQKIQSAEQEIAQEQEARVLLFLRESNALDDITNIDYSRPENHRDRVGYYGAFVDSQAMAKKHQPLTEEVLCQWQAWILTEQNAFGHVGAANSIGKLRSPSLPINVHEGTYDAPGYAKVSTLLSAWLKELSEALRQLDPYASSVQVVPLLADFYQRFEAIHPFVNGNGRTGRLVLNYVATWCRLPLIVVRARERSACFAAHRSMKAMRCFLAGKVKEVIQDSKGRLLHLVQDYGLSAVYKHPAVPGERIVEWHELVEAVEKWERE